MTRPLFILLIICVFGLPAFGQPWDGNGVEGDPYLIYDACDMQAIGADANYWDAHFELMADIDLGGYTGTSFNIIGNSSTKFAGAFDGNGHTIHNFTWASANDIGIGLFGYVDSGGEVKNLQLENVDVNVVGGNIIAGLAAENDGNIFGCVLTGMVSGSESWVAGLVARHRGIISDCHVRGSVSSVGTVYGNRVGGLVGKSYSGSEINGCSSECTVAGDWGLVGGLVGENWSVLSDCSSTGDVFGVGADSEWVGGLIGKNVGTVMNCYSTARVSGVGEGLGGLVGCTYSQIMDSYSSGSVSGIDRVGGLVGRHQNGQMSNCYSVGSVSGDSDVGGLIGYYSGVASAAYEKCLWNGDVNPDVNGIGNGSDPNVIGESTANMQTESTFTDAGWDFVGEVINGPNDVWTICEGEDYPRLACEKYGGGNGTEANPYLIRTSCQMNAIGADSNDWDKHFKLMADIDLSAYTGTSFNIIGEYGWPYDKAFTGVFDGDEHTISHFNYVDSDRDYVGIFAYVGANSQVLNLHLMDVNIAGCWCVGPVGALSEGLVSNCSATGIVSGEENVGGLVGMNEEGSIIENCNTNIVIEIRGDDYAFSVGGLVGYNFYGTVTNSFASGSIIGSTDTYYTGGLVGFHRGGEITNCYANVPVSGFWYIGGLIGNNEGPVYKCYATGDVNCELAGGGLIGRNYSPVDNCYARGDVGADEGAGGLIGWFCGLGAINNCYSTGAVEGVSEVGGLVGDYERGSYTRCFWDVNVNPDVNGIGNYDDPNVIGKTTAEMQTESTFTDAGWDFVGESANGTDDFWDICEGTNYPKLVWQTPLLGDFGCPDGVDMNDLVVLCGQWLFEELSADVWPDGGDGIVNFLDWAIFADGWQITNDIFDLADFADQWLKTGANYLIADIAPSPEGDGIVNFRDFTTLANNWLAGVE